MGLKSKVKKSVKKVSKVATAAKPIKKVGNKAFNAVKEAAAPVVAAAAPVAAAIATGGVSAAIPFVTSSLLQSQQIQQYVPLQEDYFPAEEDYVPVYEDYASNYASHSLSSALSPAERELLYKQAYNNALKSVSSPFKEEGGFLSRLLKILFG